MDSGMHVHELAIWHVDPINPRKIVCIFNGKIAMFHLCVDILCHQIKVPLQFKFQCKWTWYHGSAMCHVDNRYPKRMVIF